MAICTKVSAPEVGDFRASSLNTLVRMVSQGVGITLLPVSAVGTEVRQRDGISLCRLPKRIHGRTICLAWRRRSARKKEFHLLAHEFLENPPEGVSTFR